MFIPTQEGPRVQRRGAGWPRSLALGPVCLQDQGQLASFSVPAPGSLAGLVGSFLVEEEEVWEGRKGSVSLATSDSPASRQIHREPTGPRVKDLLQGGRAMGSWNGEFQGARVSRLWSQSCVDLESHGSSKPTGSLEVSMFLTWVPVRATLNLCRMWARVQ